MRKVRSGTPIGRPFAKGNPGRPKNTPNKLSRTAKENIEKVYADLGGIAAHVAHLKSHPRELARFYAEVYPKLLPMDMKHEHSGPDGGPIALFEMPRPK